MMRKGAALFALLCFSYWCNAQRFAVNVHGGYNKTSLSDHPVYNQSIDAWSIGMGYVHQLNKYVGVQAELNYDLKGARGDITSYNSSGNKILSYSQNLQLHYVTVPVMARLNLGSGKFKVIANAGFYYGFLAGAWVNPQTKDISHDVTSDFNRNDLGLAAGAGFLYQLTPSYGLSLEWRNNTGFLSVSPTANNQFNRSNNVQLGMHYTFLQKED